MKRLVGVLLAGLLMGCSGDDCLTRGQIDQAKAVRTLVERQMENAPLPEFIGVAVVDVVITRDLMYGIAQIDMTTTLGGEDSKGGLCGSVYVMVYCADGVECKTVGAKLVENPKAPAICGLAQ